MERDALCVSDHFGVSFSISEGVGKAKGKSRSCFNFNKADFLGLNVALSRVDWDSIISGDANRAWNRFRDTLLECCEKYIPKKRIKGSFEPLWYDRDCKRARRIKEELRKKFVSNPNPVTKEKYNGARKEFKSLIVQKMNNYFGVTNSNSLTKRFWSHIKSSSKCQRIPPTVYRDNISRTEPSAKACLFNTHFASQFSEPSQYNIDIDLSQSNRF